MKKRFIAAALGMILTICIVALPIVGASAEETTDITTPDLNYADFAPAETHPNYCVFVNNTKLTIVWYGIPYYNELTYNSYLNYESSYTPFPLFTSAGIEANNGLYVATVSNLNELVNVINSKTYTFINDVQSPSTPYYEELEFPYQTINSGSFYNTSGYTIFTPNVYFYGGSTGSPYFCISLVETDSDAQTGAGYYSVVTLSQIEAPDLFQLIDVTAGMDYASGYDEGLKNGYKNGHYIGYNSGYSEGYDKGVADQQSLYGYIAAIGEAPANMIQEMFNFEILGVNVSTVIFALLTTALVVILLKKFT